MASSFSGRTESTTVLLSLARLLHEDWPATLDEMEARKKR